jgi:hypothetical protein
MDDKDLRLECLKIAADMHRHDANGDADTVLATARKMIAFINEAQDKA